MDIQKYRQTGQIHHDAGGPVLDFYTGYLPLCGKEADIDISIDFRKLLPMQQDFPVRVKVCHYSSLSVLKMAPFGQESSWMESYHCTAFCFFSVINSRHEQCSAPFSCLTPLLVDNTF